MARVTHPILGAIDPSETDYWEADVTFGGRSVSVDLTIEDPELEPSALAALPQSLNDIEPLDRAARAAILSDAQSEDDDAAAALYLTHHHEVLSAEDYLRCFGSTAPDLASPGAALARLKLVRVGLYPTEQDRRVLLDYSIDPETTSYLLCVSFDAGNQPVAIDLES